MHSLQPHRWLRIGLILVAMGLAALALPLRAATDAPTATAADAQNVRLIGQIGGSVNAVYVADNKAYLSQGVGMIILDVSQDDQPQLLGRSAPLADRVNGLVVQGTVAYIAAGSAGLYLVDVTVPALPTPLGAYNTPGSAIDVAYGGNYIYVADWDSGLRVVDVSNPAAPREVGALDTPGSALGVTVVGNYAYVADSEQGLRVVDVSNPAAPREVGFYDTPGTASKVVVAGNYAYVADGDSGLRVVNVSNPAAPSAVGSLDTAGNSESLQLAGNQLYLADGNNGLRVVDVSNPAAPSEVGFSTIPQDAQGVMLVGATAYVADGNDGLRIFSVGNPATPSELGFYDTLGFASHIAVAGNYAYVTDYHGDVRIVNVSNPAAPSEVGLYDTPGGARGVQVVGAHAYVADGNGLRVVNVSNPAAPSAVGFYDSPGSAWDLHVAGNFAYLADGNGLRVVDVSDPTAPRSVGFYGTSSSWVTDVFVVGNHAYINDWDLNTGIGGLRVVNVSNPAAPNAVGFLATPTEVQSIFVVGNFAYVGDKNGLRVINVSNPAAPSQVGFYATVGSAAEVVVAGSHAYAANNFAGLRVVNISNAATPTEAGFYDTPGFAADVALGGNYAYVAGGTGGLYALRYPACYSLRRKVNGQGALPTLAVDRSSGCQLHEYLPGAQVTLSANPAPNWRVASWVGTSNDNTTSTNNQLTMPAVDHEVTVNYAPVCYTLTLGHSGTGTAPTAAPPNSAGCAAGQYAINENIILSAAPGAGYTVGSWSGVANPASTAMTATLTMPGANHSASVNYVPACYALTLNHSGSGSDPVATPANASGCPVGRYHFNDAVALSGATPEPGWQIGSWSGTVNNASTANTNSLTMPASDHIASVNYTEIPTAGPGDNYETDNTCTRSRSITADGSETQPHTFHAAGDADWVRITAQAGVTYRIEVQVPVSSTADVNLEVYARCEDAPIDDWKESFSPGARLDVPAPASGQIYVRVTNQEATAAGNGVSYQLSVRALSSEASNRALIILAGRLKGADNLQKNIHNVTQAVYTLFQRNGYTDDNIYYLATDTTLAGHDALATKDNLRAAITQWAKSKIDRNGALTLYLMDHGSPEVFYIDDVSNQRLSPAELDGWLNELEAALPGVKINVIIEACQSGSFITQPGSLSKSSRVIIASTNDVNDAKASKDGAYFSDHLLTWLHQGYNLLVAFDEAKAVAGEVFRLQQAMLDANGNGVPNELSDAAIAASRSFAYAGTFSSDDWPPHIFSVQGPPTIANFKGVIQADVRDNQKVRQVWAVVYPPDYAPPPTGQALQAETLPTFLLTPVDNGNLYAGEFTGFTQAGVYRIVLHAEDQDGLVARPLVIEVQTGNRVFLPVVRR